LVVTEPFKVVNKYNGYSEVLMGKIIIKNKELNISFRRTIAVVNMIKR